VILAAELIAIALALARQDNWLAFLSDVGRTSLVLLWLALTSSALLCLLRPRLASRELRQGTLIAWTAVQVNVVVVSEILYWIAYWMSPEAALGRWLPPDHVFFAARNVAVSSILLACVLRYFYVADQWQRNVRREAESRIHALQARIRPHFLFNSMNTIASLTRTNPEAAEQAVEDLADLFRASLADSAQRISLGQELEIARVYERMERQRLGDRLSVQWQLDGLPLDARLPGLTIQPLLENAIYHGIERMTAPGEVAVHGHREADMLYISVTNPLPGSGVPDRPGARMALDNIRERLNLAFGGKGGLRVEESAGQYRVTLAFPCQT
jgi:two-component system sensor histidine kinase AlgZ